VRLARRFRLVRGSRTGTHGSRHRFDVIALIPDHSTEPVCRQYALRGPPANCGLRHLEELSDLIPGEPFCGHDTHPSPVIEAAVRPSHPPESPPRSCPTGGGRMAALTSVGCILRTRRDTASARTEGDVPREHQAGAFNLAQRSASDAQGLSRRRSDGSVSCATNHIPPRRERGGEEVADSPERRRPA